MHGHTGAMTTTVLHDLDGAVARARRLVAAGGRMLGIAGAPGAGKSWLVDELLVRLVDLAPAHVPMDGFHLADVTLDRLGLRDVKGAPETFDVGGYVAALRRIASRAEERVYVPGFSRDLEEPLAAALEVSRDAGLVVTEGNYLLLDEPGWREACGLLDEVWYVDVPDDVRVRRLVERHVTFGKARDEAVAWVRRSDEVNARRVAAVRGRADVEVLLG